MNIAILVIRFVHLLLDKKLAQLLDEVEAIKQYSYRYLNHPDTTRSFNFFKMLMQIPIGRFERERIMSKAAPFLKILEEHPLQVANQIHEIELIPYDTLWNIAMEQLNINK